MHIKNVLFAWLHSKREYERKRERERESCCSAAAASWVSVEWRICCQRRQQRRLQSNCLCNCFFYLQLFFSCFVILHDFFLPSSFGCGLCFATTIICIIIANSTNAPCGFCGRRVPLLLMLSCSHSQVRYAEWIGLWDTQMQSTFTCEAQTSKAFCVFYCYCFYFFFLFFTLCFMHYVWMVQKSFWDCGTLLPVVW